jgi:signal transduction histidine kinase
MEQVISPAVVLMEPAFHAKEITMTVEVPGDLPLVWADAEKMHQVLVNVFANALAATPPHGAVSVVVGARAASSEELDRGRHVADAMSPLVITVAVRDTGCGMPEADVQKAFQPFFTTKAVGKGTGLGLFLSRETVLAHGGSLLLESETGRGTTVTVTLPGLKTEPTRVTERD